MDERHGEIALSSLRKIRYHDLHIVWMTVAYLYVIQALASADTAACSTVTRWAIEVLALLRSFFFLSRQHLQLKLLRAHPGILCFIGRMSTSNLLENARG